MTSDAPAHDSRQLEEVFRLSPSCMAILTGPEHVFERANDRYLDLIGRRDVVGRRARDVLPELVEQGFVELLDRVYRTGEPFVGHDVPIMLAPPGQPPQRHVFDFVYQPMRDAQGEVTGIFAQAIDLTGRHRAEADLHATHARLDLVLHHLRDYGLVVIDAEGRVTDWAADAAAITGYTAEEAIGRSAHLIFLEEDIAQGVPESELVIARREGRAEDRRWHRRKDGSRFYANGVVVPLRDAGGRVQGFGKLFRDETQLQRQTERRTLLLVVARHLLEHSLPPRELAETVFGMIRELLGVDLLLNYQCEPDGRLSLIAAAGLPPGQRERLAALRPGQSCCGQVAGTARPAVQGDGAIDGPVAALQASLGATAWACHPLVGGDGHVLGTFAVGSTTRRPFDIDEVHFLQAISHFLALAWDRWQATHALQALTAQSGQRQRLYETALSNTPDLVYVFDREHRFTYANEGLLRMWGRSWDEAIGRTCLELGYEPWHAAMHAREIEQVRTTKQPIRGEVPFEGTFGRRIYDYIFVPVIGPDGEVEAIAGTARDVTERKSAEDELASLLQREQRRAGLHAQLASAGESLGRLLSVDQIAGALAEQARHLLDAHLAVASLTVDQQWAQAVSGVSLSERYARWRDYASLPDGSGIYAEVCRTNTPLRLTQAELEAHPAWRGFGVHAKDHPPMRGWLAVPLVGQDGRNLGVVQLSDKAEGEFTAEDQAILTQLASIASVSIENARLYERLHEQDRRKDEFLAMLAHELRNPLAPIRTGLGVLALSPPPAQATRVQAMMERQVGHMVRLIDDLLDVSRITRGKIELRREHVTVRSVIDAAVELSRPLIEAGHHQLHVEVSEAPMVLDADPTRLAQLVSNLLNNAAKYTPEGGRIEVVARRVASRAVISVRDNGVGLGTETLPHVFDLFSQAGGTLDRAQGGLGIGLALVRRLVELHGGEVEAGSAGPGLGSTFEVRLPLVDGDAPARAIPVTRAARTVPRRVLVVDDNVDAAQSLAMLLELQGHAVEVAHDGMAALEHACAAPPDVALLDLDMPGMGGLEVARRLRSAAGGGRMVLVALTGLGSSADQERTGEAGFDAHLTKPVAVEALDGLLQGGGRDG